MSLLQEINKITDDTTIATVEESSGDTGVTSTTSSSNTMNVIVDISREIVVDDMLHVGDIETTGCNSGSDQDGATPVSEHLKSTLTLTLSTITVNGGCWEVLVDQEVREGVGHALSFDKDQGETSAMSVKDVEENRALVHILNVLDLLGDVLGCGTNTTDRQEDVIFQEISCQHLDVAGEGG
jgi:hypothetical protein